MKIFQDGVHVCVCATEKKGMPSLRGKVMVLLRPAATGSKLEVDNVDVIHKSRLIVITHQ